MIRRPTRQIGQTLLPLGRRLGQAVLLDTNAIIRAQLGHGLTAEARAAIEAAEANAGILVSPVSIWELGLLARNRESRTGRLFAPDVETWVQNLMAAPGVRLAPVSASIALSAWRLPEPIHGDPADRLLIATARELNVKLVTRDRVVLDYATLGHVDAIAC